MTTSIGSRTSILCAIPALVAASGLAGQLADPIPERILRSGVAVVVEDHLVLPASADRPPRARINHLRVAVDGSDREFVNDLRGTLYVIADGSVSTYLDLAARMPRLVDAPGLGSGFGSFAFHPDFASNGLFYTVHTETLDGGARPDFVGPSTVEPVIQGVVTEWHTEDALAGTFAGTHREVLRIEFPGVIHGIQEIAFDPTAAPGSPGFGLLFVCVGEGGSVAAELTDNSGRLDSALGTILRIDPSGRDSRNGAYGIPPDNPWAGDGDASTLGEIWAAGFRNPNRISWDDGSGVMLISEIGESNVEEIDVGVAGAHYGFPEREGSFGFDPLNRPSVHALPPGADSDRFTDPVVQYDHDEGNAAVGGFVYRGTRIPALRGHYVFGDIPTGRLFHFDVEALEAGGPVPFHELTLVRADGAEVSLRTLVGSQRVDLHFGLDAEGEPYLLTKADGAIRRLTGQADRIQVRPALRGEVESEWTIDGSGTWTQRDGVLVLEAAGTPSGPIRKPAAVAVLRDRVFRDVTIEADVRSTADPSVIRADVLLVLAYRSPDHFYYAHLSGITDPVHNGIFVVDGADRRRIDEATSRPALGDRAWHRVRLEHHAESGRIAVYVDGSPDAVLEATDRTFGSGMVGFGSFDDTAEIRNVVIAGALRR